MIKIKKSKYPTSCVESVQSLYETSDLYLSAYLRSCGLVLKGTYEEKQRVVFVFNDEGNVHDLIREYFNDGHVGVLSFKGALRDLRSIIANHKNLLPSKDYQDG